jgi:hypothetical protein
MKTFNQYITQRKYLETTEVPFQLLKNLFKNLQYLLGPNQIHREKLATTDQGRQAILVSVKWALENAKTMEGLNVNDPEQLSRNAQQILELAYNTIKYLLPLYQKHIPDKIPQTLLNIEEIYRKIVSS